VLQKKLWKKKRKWNWKRRAGRTMANIWLLWDDRLELVSGGYK